MKGYDLMKDIPEKISLPENDQSVFPNTFKLNSNSHHTHIDHSLETPQNKFTKVDTTSHVHNTHRPRQLSGRHH